MQIPTPNEYAKQHGHNPFPPRWERWLSTAREAILASQPQGGRNVSVDEYPGKGTVINVERTRPEKETPGAPTGACCVDIDCTITTEADCISAGGTYQGDNTVCDPNPCETPPCPCSEGFMFQPFTDGMGGYYATVTSDCCALMTTYSDPVDASARFATMSSVNTACGAGFTGSNSCTYIIDPDTCEQVRTECTGEVDDPDSNCVNDCAFDCDCNTGSCQPHVTNTTTLSDECIP